MNCPRSLRRWVLLLLMAALSVLMALPVSAQLLSPEEAPAVATFAKNGTPREVFTFSADDFLVENSQEALDSIVLTSLPDSNAGVLTLGGMDLASGEAVSMEAVSGMAFTPNDSPTVATTGFTFTPVFADGSAGEDVTVDLYLLTAENAAPIARDLELNTYKNVAAQGQFSAVDPEGDLLTFRLVDKPARGAVTLPEDGSAALFGRGRQPVIAVDQLCIHGQERPLSVCDAEDDSAVRLCHWRCLAEIIIERSEKFLL